MIDLTKLWNAMPRDVQRKISCHDLKRIVDNYNASPEDRARCCPEPIDLVVSVLVGDSNFAAPCPRDSPDRNKLRMIRDVALQEGDWAVECSNPGVFLKVHPDQFGQIASGPAYSFFRENH